MSARLSEIVRRRGISQDPLITGVTSDSRAVKPGYLFAALPGSKADGRTFIPGSIGAGAAAVLAPADVDGLPVPTVHALDVRRAYALAAAAFWKEQPPVIVAVTGTNGKTSVAAFCRQIFARLGHKAASMGTLGVVADDDELSPPGLTTPDAGDVARWLSVLAKKGVTHLALEASSHGMDQRRLDGVRLTAAGFTNFTQDHLDYHNDMDAYRAAKQRLFEVLLPRGGTAVMNADSAALDAFAGTARLHGKGLYTVGENGQGLRLISREPLADGQILTIEADKKTYKVKLPFAGAFQASNALVAAGLCIAAKEPAAKVIAAMKHLKGAPGRMQRIGAGPKGGEAYIDYAHTPDGLATVLDALRPHASGRLIVVFGAGGDRDAGKRVQMGEAAARRADLVIVTDDNPRSEDPAKIRKAVLAGAKGATEIADRKQAIEYAAAQLRDGDVLVVAGKGHEQGQIVGDKVLPFDDAAVTAGALGV
jgi:UDP-N-acetylmuramoyl-L-alanyl-D-glutamate--2,6-diaminopimelate ligase